MPSQSTPPFWSLRNDRRQALVFVDGCAWCATPFLALKHEVDAGRARHCSPTCAFNDSRKRVQRVCVGCGERFWAVPSEVARGHGKYHSADCARRARMNHDLRALLDANHRVDPVRGCWLWTAGTASGYGTLSWRGKNHSASRVAFFLANGRWPTPQVRHLCEGLYLPGDTTCRLCVNPEHLGEGDARAQAADRRASGHLLVGERMYHARLTNALVSEARRRHAAGRTTFTQLAREYGVDRATIRRAIVGITWRHVPAPEPVRRPDGGR